MIAMKDAARGKAETPYSMTSSVERGARRRRRTHRQLCPGVSVLRGARCHIAGEIEPPLDAIEPTINVIEPLLKDGAIQFEVGDLALERAEPRHNLVEFAINTVKALVEPRETSAQKVEDVASLAHA
jgi:hypothetical protein